MVLTPISKDTPRWLLIAVIAFLCLFVVADVWLIFWIHCCKYEGVGPR